MPMTDQKHEAGENGLAPACRALHLPLHVLAWTEGAKGVGLKRDALCPVRPDG